MIRKLSPFFFDRVPVLPESAWVTNVRILPSRSYEIFGLLLLQLWPHKPDDYRKFLCNRAGFILSIIPAKGSEKIQGREKREVKCTMPCSGKQKFPIY